MVKTNLNIYTNSKIKEEAEIIYKNMGLDLNTAINMFLIKTIEDRKIPFTFEENIDSLQARCEALYMNDELPVFNSATQVWEALNKD